MQAQNFFGQVPQQQQQQQQQQRQQAPYQQQQQAPASWNHGSGGGGASSFFGGRPGGSGGGGYGNAPPMNYGGAARSGYGGSAAPPVSEGGGAGGAMSVFSGGPPSSSNSSGPTSQYGRPPVSGGAPGGGAAGLFSSAAPSSMGGYPSSATGPARNTAYGGPPASTATAGTGSAQGYFSSPATQTSSGQTTGADAAAAFGRPPSSTPTYQNPPRSTSNTSLKDAAAAFGQPPTSNTQMPAYQQPPRSSSNSNLHDAPAAFGQPPSSSSTPVTNYQPARSTANNNLHDAAAAFGQPPSSSSTPVPAYQQPPRTSSKTNLSDATAAFGQPPTSTSTPIYSHQQPPRSSSNTNLAAAAATFGQPASAGPTAAAAPPSSVSATAAFGAPPVTAGTVAAFDKPPSSAPVTAASAFGAPPTSNVSTGAFTQAPPTNPSSTPLDKPPGTSDASTAFAQTPSSSLSYHQQQRDTSVGGAAGVFAGSSSSVVQQQQQQQRQHREPGGKLDAAAAFGQPSASASQPVTSSQEFHPPSSGNTPSAAGFFDAAPSSAAGSTVNPAASTDASATMDQNNSGGAGAAGFFDTSGAMTGSSQATTVPPPAVLSSSAVESATITGPPTIASAMAPANALGYYGASQAGHPSTPSAAADVFGTSVEQPVGSGPESTTTTTTTTTTMTSTETKTKEHVVGEVGVGSGGHSAAVASVTATSSRVVTEEQTAVVDRGLAVHGATASHMQSAQQRESPSTQTKKSTLMPPASMDTSFAMQLAAKREEEKERKQQQEESVAASKKNTTGTAKSAIAAPPRSWNFTLNLPTPPPKDGSKVKSPRHSTAVTGGSAAAGTTGRVAAPRSYTAKFKTPPPLDFTKMKKVTAGAAKPPLSRGSRLPPSSARIVPSPSSLPWNTGAPLVPPKPRVGGGGSSVRSSTPSSLRAASPLATASVGSLGGDTGALAGQGEGSQFVTPMPTAQTRADRSPSPAEAASVSNNSDVGSVRSSTPIGSKPAVMEPPEPASDSESKAAPLTISDGNPSVSSSIMAEAVQPPAIASVATPVHPDTQTSTSAHDGTAMKEQATAHALNASDQSVPSISLAPSLAGASASDQDVSDVTKIGPPPVMTASRASPTAAPSLASEGSSTPDAMASMLMPPARQVGHSQTKLSQTQQSDTKTTDAVSAMMMPPPRSAPPQGTNQKNSPVDYMATMMMPPERKHVFGKTDATQANSSAVNRLMAPPALPLDSLPSQPPDEPADKAAHGVASITALPAQQIGPSPTQTREESDSEASSRGVLAGMMKPPSRELDTQLSHTAQGSVVVASHVAASSVQPPIAQQQNLSAEDVLPSSDDKARSGVSADDVTASATTPHVPPNAGCEGGGIAPEDFVPAEDGRTAASLRNSRAEYVTSEGIVETTAPEPSATGAKVSTEPSESNTGVEQQEHQSQITEEGKDDGPLAPGSNALPEGWAAYEDPASGMTYFYNQGTGETTWETPQPELDPASQEQANTPAEEQANTPAEEQTSTSPEVDVPSSLPVAEASALEDSVSANQIATAIPEQSPEIDVPTTDVANEHGLETNGSEGRSVGREENEPETMMLNSDDTREAAASFTLDVAEEKASEVSQCLPPGWKELLDPSSNMPYYLHEEHGVTTWDKPICPKYGEGEDGGDRGEQDVTVAKNEGDAGSGEGHIEESETSGTTSHAAAPVTVSEIANEADSHTGDQHTSVKGPENADNKHEIQESSAESTQTEANKSLGHEEPKSSQSRLPPGWRELFDSSSSMPYYLHEEQGITTWDKPTFPEDAEEREDRSDGGRFVPQASTTIIEAQGETAEKEAVASATDSVEASSSETGEHSGTKSATEASHNMPVEKTDNQPLTTNRNSTESKEWSPEETKAADPPLPAGWKELLDPSSNMPYYLHEERGVTTWDKPSHQLEGDVKENNEDEKSTVMPDWSSTTAEAGDARDVGLVPEVSNDVISDGAVVENDEAAGLGSISPEPEGAPTAESVLEHENPHTSPPNVKDEGSQDAGVLPEKNVSNNDRVTSQVMLPSGWIELIDPSTRMPYYLHEGRGITTWEPPKDAEAEPSKEKESSLALVKSLDSRELEGDSTVSTNLIHGTTSPVDEKTGLTSNENEIITEVGEVTPMAHTQVEDSSSTNKNSGSVQTVIEEQIHLKEKKEKENETENENENENENKNENKNKSKNEEHEKKESFRDNRKKELDRPESPLPSGWVELVDPGSKLAYYFNEEKGVTTWEKPAFPAKEEKDRTSGSSSESEEMKSGAGDRRVSASPKVLSTDTRKAQVAPNENVMSAGSKQITEQRDRTHGDGGAKGGAEEAAASLGKSKENLSSEAAGKEKGILNNKINEQGDGQKNIDSSLAAGWVEVKDPSSGAIYYWNEADGQTTWTRPVIESETPEAKGEKLEEQTLRAIGNDVGNIGNTSQKDLRNTTALSEQADKSKQNGRAMRPPCAVVSFGFGGRLCVAKPVPASVSTRKEGEVAPSTTINVDVYRLHQIVDTQLFSIPNAGESVFTGPWNSVKESAVWDYLNKKCDDKLPDDTSDGKEQRSNMLWKLIRVAAHSKGRLRSDVGAKDPKGPESAIVNILLGDDHSDSRMKQLSMSPAATLISRDANVSNLKKAELEAMRDVQALLLRGKREEAVASALERKQYALALLVATVCDRKTYQNAARCFADETVSSGSPLHTLLMLFSGQLQVSKEDRTNTTNGRRVAAMAPKTYWGTSDGENLLENWRYHVASILSNRTSGWDKLIRALGDQLLQLGNVEAAHFCFMVGGSPVTGPSPKSRLVLVGCDCTITSHSALMTRGGVEAFERTEAFEWAKRRGNSNAAIPALQPFKLAYASLLADFGCEKLSKAYVDSIRSCAGLEKNREKSRLNSVYSDTFVEELNVLESRLCVSLGESLDGQQWDLVMPVTEASKSKEKLRSFGSTSVKKAAANTISAVNERTTSEDFVMISSPASEPMTSVSIGGRLPSKGLQEPSNARIQERNYKMQNTDVREEQAPQKDPSADNFTPTARGVQPFSSTGGQKPVTEDNFPFGSVAPISDKVLGSTTKPVSKKKIDPAPHVSADDKMLADSGQRSVGLSSKTEDKVHSAPSTVPTVGNKPPASTSKLPDKPSSWQKAGIAAKSEGVPKAPKSTGNARSAPSSDNKSGKTPWWKAKITKILHPNAVTADTGGAMEAYYDEKLKRWVFPDDDPAELAKPLAPPPKMPVVAEPSTPAQPASNDPLAALMAPPSRGPHGRPPSAARNRYPDPLASMGAVQKPTIPTSSADGQDPSKVKTDVPKFTVFNATPSSKGT